MPSPLRRLASPPDERPFARRDNNTAEAVDARSVNIPAAVAKMRMRLSNSVTLFLAACLFPHAEGGKDQPADPEYGPQNTGEPGNMSG